MAKSILDKLSDESVVNQIWVHSKSHLENIQRENKKGSGRRKAECAPHLQKYYADGPGNDVVQVSKELKKALNLKKIESGKPVKLLVAEAIVQYLGVEKLPSENTMRKVVIFTDAACKGNPGRGGIGYYLISEAGKTLKGSKSYLRKTSSRMELMAAIEALRLLKFPCKVELYTDSRYLADSVNKGWLNTWLASPFFLNRKNEDLWRKLALELQKHQVGIHWIKGHSKYTKNCLVDRLASGACSSGKYLADPGYGR